MCGIAGIVLSGPGGEEALRPVIQRMTDALAHRGPDGQGVSVLPGCLLGHRRLSIIDLAAGKQPMASPDERHWVTFNGEIYGYQELRDRTEYPYRTESDTEVLLALYRNHGTDLPRLLPGMFAFALWDQERNRLVAARDRFGEKPFFWALSPEGHLLFASELEALLASGLIRPSLDRESLAYFLQRQFVPPGRCIYQEVHSLAPGHQLVWEAGEVRVERYWSLPEPGEELSLEEACERFREFFSRAVRRQLVADVPVGAFLSGGLDSSTVVAEASRLRPGLTTFSFGFQERSELPFARAVAELHGTEHVELEEPRPDLCALFQEMPRVYDQPFADLSCIPTYLISRRAREHLKVILSGDGADELLGGYSPWYQPLLGLPALRDRNPTGAWLAYTALRALRRLGFRLGPDQTDLVRAYPVHLRGGRTVLETHWEHGQGFSPGELAELGLEPAPRPRLTEDRDSVDDALRTDLQDYLPGDILVKTDRASMAHGLELRAPFLDVDLASFLIALPPRLKVSTECDKILLREAFARDWPASVRKRHKQGFAGSPEAMLAAPGMDALQEEYLAAPGARVREHLDPRGIAAARARSPHQTWNLLVLGAWLESRGVPLSRRD